MPAEPSSAIPAALIQLTHANPLQETEAPHLLAYLATISDPRGRRGRRHPLVAILAIAAAAVLAGARSMAAIAEWAADAPQLVRVALGARRDAPAHWVVPSEATIRRTLARLDAEALAEVIGAWLADRDRPDQRRRRRAVAVDGKTLRGARRDGRAVRLLAAMEHAARRVLAQRTVNGAPGEVPGFQPLLADLDLAGAVVTADALHAHAEAAQFLVTTKRADYLFTVKANQPTLLNRCARLAWQQVPVLDHTRHRAHGRVEIRTLKAVTVRGLGFPHASQVLQVTRKTRDLRSRRWRPVVAYAVTSLAHARASPARLADLLRGHWSIELDKVPLQPSQGVALPYRLVGDRCEKLGPLLLRKSEPGLHAGRLGCSNVANHGRLARACHDVERREERALAAVVRTCDQHKTISRYRDRCAAGRPGNPTASGSPGTWITPLTAQTVESLGRGLPTSWRTQLMQHRRGRASCPQSPNRSPHRVLNAH